MVKPERWVRYKGDLEFDYIGDQGERKNSKATIDFFAPDKEVPVSDFVTTQFVAAYKDYYFLGNTGELCPKRISKRNQSFKLIEDIFFFGEKSILEKKEKWTLTDVLNILAWKTGNIDHEKSKNEGRLIYKDGWSVNETKDEYSIKLRAYSLSGNAYRDFAKKIIDIRERYSNEPSNDNSLWKELMAVAENVQGLGPVYLITLMFFITKGKYPIYDRFAMAALLSLLASENGYNLPHDESIVRKTSLPEKSGSTELSKLKLYNNYIGLLHHFFGQSWKNDREIDQALWVYGHYFDVQQ